MLCYWLQVQIPSLQFSKGQGETAALSGDSWHHKLPKRRRLCEDHFREEDIQTGKGGRQFLRKGALPKAKPLLQPNPSPTSTLFPANVVWKCKDRDLGCHKIILAASSPFLKSALLDCNEEILAASSPFLKSGQIPILLPSPLSPRGVDDVVSVFYQGQCQSHK